MAEQQRQVPGKTGETHRLVLEQRKQLTVTAVTEVLHVEANSVVLRLSQSLLVIQGEELRLKQLSEAGGLVEIQGAVSALRYEKAPVGGRLRRLFG